MAGYCITIVFCEQGNNQRPRWDSRSVGVPTEVVRTPHASGAGEAGAGGVSMNSKSSEDSE